MEEEEEGADGRGGNRKEMEEGGGRGEAGSRWSPGAPGIRQAVLLMHHGVAGSHHVRRDKGTHP